MSPTGPISLPNLMILPPLRSAAAAASWMARHTRSGVSGRSRIGTPMASRTAAATAEATHSSAPSLMPLDAVRARPVGVLDRLAVELERQVHAGRDPVVDGAQVPDPAPLVEDVVLHERVAEAHDRRALVLHPDLERVEGLAHVATP